MRPARTILIMQLSNSRKNHRSDEGDLPALFSLKYLLLMWNVL